MEKALVLFFGLLVFTSCDTINNDVVQEDECDLPSELIQEIASYQPTVNRIIDSVTKGKHRGQPYKLLEDFIDKFGARQAGTKNLEDSIDYVFDLMRKYNLENVHGENVTVPHWIRGHESAEMLQPRKAKIAVLGLGGTISTPPEGIEAEVLVVRSFDELNQPNVSAAAKGKIIVFNNDYITYGKSVVYRSQGAVKASQHGAVAALVRSVTPFSMYTPHTGHQSYRDDVKKIPVASITVEDAKMLQRYQDKGIKAVIKLHLQSEHYPDATSRNAVGEIVGSQKPEKVVIVSGHIDSWDVGVGAMDDGGGAFISWYSLALLKSLSLQAKRTLRVVLWTAEEPGFKGVHQYEKDHKNELDNFTFVMESDEGVFTPLGIEYTAGVRGGCVLKQIVKLLEPINATSTKYYDSVGSDIAIWARKIPTASLYNTNENYFWWHHSDADRLEVLDPDNLDKATAVWAAVSFIIADLKDEFPREFNDISTLSNSKIIETLNTLKQKPTR
ncbi:unnamed protein product [Phyllotreta striolata]|uniref:Carboxypeptidase Q n=1 Tax=Phyllotreta striolata TaxID=444603 RepID=A0A9N9THM6_PHYSR|nr:unnamed protein product [Phyllotreta striolata]